MLEVPRAAIWEVWSMIVSRARWAAREISHRAAVSMVPCRQADPSCARQILTVTARIAPSPAPAIRLTASQATAAVVRWRVPVVLVISAIPAAARMSARRIEEVPWPGGAAAGGP
jgi:hypothetical protein